MKELVSLKHMEIVPPEERSATAYYMPHHAVFNHDGSKKIRVVSNASQRTTSGSSLNDFLITGPKLQRDIFIILTRWRLFAIVFTADIIKMFRQFRIAPEDLDWLSIVWRNS